MVELAVDDASLEVGIRHRAIPALSAVALAARGDATPLQSDTLRLRGSASDRSGTKCIRGHASSHHNIFVIFVKWFSNMISDILF